MAKKPKEYHIRIIRPTRASGIALAPGAELKSPNQISREDAYALLKMGKATPVSDTKTAARITAKKEPKETR
jgi:hypothetical protein